MQFFTLLKGQTHPHQICGALPVVSKNIFEHELMLPEVFFGTIVQGSKVTSEDSGERMLMLAVLEDAVSAYQRYALEKHLGLRAQRIFQEAVDWILDDVSRPFSFVNICDVFEINTEYLRGGLKHWRATSTLSITARRFRRVAGRRTHVIKARSRRAR